jgi:trans-aconitate methyltransferase
MAKAESYGDNLFNQDRHEEAERLRQLALAFDAPTCMRLKMQLPSRGARCLDVGAGTGRVSIWLARQPELVEGEVVALDRDVRLLEQIEDVLPNLRIVQRDITIDDDSLGLFDVVHARFVLMHLRDRIALLSRLASWLKPGGWLVLSDYIDHSAPQASFAPYREVMDAMWVSLKQSIGTEIEWAHSLPHRLRDAGLQDIGSEVYMPSVDSRSPAAAFWRLTWRQMRERLLAVGTVDADVLRQAEDALIRDDFFEFSPGMLTAWGCRPLLPLEVSIGE